MSAYTEYQTINLPWLKEIPAHWKAQRNKNIFVEQKEIVGEKSAEYTLLSLTLNGIVPRDMEGGGKFPESFDKYKVVRNGDMVFCLFDIDETPRTVGLSSYDGMLTGAYTIMRISNINPRYVYYYYLALDNRKMLKPLYSGLRKTININTFQSTKVPVPPREEQDQIVRFLDWKVSSINKLISIKKKQIEEIKNLKIFYISKAVTNGVADNGIITDSSVGLSWDRVKIGYKSWIRARLGWRGLKATEYVDEGYPFVSAFNIQNDKLSWQNLNFINQFRYDESPEIKLSVGDILLVKDGAGIGKCARIDELPYGESTPNGSLAVITPDDDLLYKYLYYYLISEDFKNATNRIITGMGVPHLTQHFLKNVEVPCPPFDMQEKVAAFLDAECEKLNDMITIKEGEIRELKELRMCFIADAVTGKIDVRGIEIPEYEFMNEDTDAGDEAEDFEESEEE